MFSCKQVRRQSASTCYVKLSRLRPSKSQRREAHGQQATFCRPDALAAGAAQAVTCCSCMEPVARAEERLRSCCHQQPSVVAFLLTARRAPTSSQSVQRKRGTPGRVSGCWYTIALLLLRFLHSRGLRWKASESSLTRLVTCCRLQAEQSMRQRWFISDSAHWQPQPPLRPYSLLCKSWLFSWCACASSHA
jgi:hypothetical protein